VVLSKSTSTADDILKQLEDKSFPTSLQSSLKSENIEVTDASALAPKGVQKQLLPQYKAPAYVPTAPVEQLHGWSPLGDKPWSTLLSGEKSHLRRTHYQKGEDYLVEVFSATAILSVIFILWLLEYLLFLCAQSCSCCKKCCGCCNQKACFTCGPCKPCSRFSPKVSKCVHITLFLVMVVMILATLQGKTNFMKGMNGVVKSLRDTGSKFAEMENIGNDFSVQSTRFGDIATNADCKKQESNDVLKKTSKSFKTAVDLLNGLWKDLAKSMNDKAQTMDDVAKLMDVGIMATMGVFIFIAVLAILAAVIGGYKGWCVLRLAVFFSVLVVAIFAILVGVEFGLSMLIADFCHAGPLVNMKTAVADPTSEFYIADREALDMMSYYLTCKGGADASPMYQPLSDATDFMTVLQTVTKSLGTGACADADMQKIYGKSGVAAKVIAGFEGLTGVVSCPKSVNPLLAELTQQVLCTDTVAGLHQLWMVQSAAMAVLLIALHYAQFSRTLWVDGEYGDDSGGGGPSNKIAPQLSMNF